MIKRTLLLLVVYVSLVSAVKAPTHTIDFIPSKLQEKIVLNEGYNKKGTLPNRYNNPGALRFAHQTGAKRGWDNYAKFDNKIHGWNAFTMLLAKYRRDDIPLSKGWPYLTEDDD